MAKQENKCSQCGYLNRPENQYCTQCSTKLLNPKKVSARLTILNGKDLGKTFKLYNNVITIGRDSKNLMVLHDHQTSKNHAEIIFENDNFWIEDLNSRNGVFINGKKSLHQEKLVNGNIIKIGFTILKFEREK
jgi:pSer/pThr/pTyr-binding forkhead associated (FHA) protein